MEVDKGVVTYILATVVAQLTLMFLKTYNVIKWSWCWVLIPLWGPYAIFIICGLSIIIVLFVYNLKERIFRRHG